MQDLGNGRHYEGNFHNGSIFGKGKLSFASGDTLEANFSKDGLVNGYGVYTYKAGPTYEGSFKNQDTMVKEDINFPPMSIMMVNFLKGYSMGMEFIIWGMVMSIKVNL